MNGTYRLSLLVGLLASSLLLGCNSTIMESFPLTAVDAGEGMDALPDQQRLILVMFYFDDMSYKQIASELDVPMGTVMSRLARAKRRLRELLTEQHAPTGKG